MKWGKLGSLMIAAVNAHAVILFDTGEPEANTTAPGGLLAGSGWQYEGQFGGFLGTPIAPRYFISAKHFGNAGAIVFNGTSYAVTAEFGDPGSDLIIYRVGQDLPIVAPLYTNADETGKHLVVIGRGTQRGGEIFLNATRRGWSWGGSDSRQRWGENNVSQVVHFSSGPDDGLYATFDEPLIPGSLPNESHLSNGDSGGAVFIQDAGVWKLAGINYAVDELYTEPIDEASFRFTAAIYDARGYYEKISSNPLTFRLIEGPAAVPTGFYATRISSKLTWINAVIDRLGDSNGDGISNLLEYARSLNSAESDPGRQTRVTFSNGNALFVYRRINNAPELQYQVKESADLVQWDPVVSTDSVLGTSENVSTIEAQIAGGTQKLLRLFITQP